MEYRSIDRSATFFGSSFLEDYLGSGKFDELRSFSPDLEGIKKAMDARLSFSKEKRSVLSKDLSRQYRDAQITLDAKSPVNQGIELLKKENTFTITTGQQIHIGLGPLYVFYKALDVISICKQLREKYDNYHFVPVFWMASEDHDLEEIQDVKVFGQEFKWNSSQSGAVGRMTTTGIPELFSEIQSNFRFNEVQEDFINRCREFYSNTTLSVAFRKLIHSYFEESGLVVLDADSKVLKESFIPVMRDEIFGSNYDSLTDTTQKLKSLGYPQQLVIRNTNLFHMNTVGRHKMSLNENKVNSENGEMLVYKDEIDPYLEREAVNVSPNAALRPLYQEWVLPNLVYVGGPGEIRYWLQLKGVFDNYEMKMPMLQLRTSNIILPQKAQRIVGEDIDLMFQDEQVIINHYDSGTNEVSIRIEALEKSISESLGDYISYTKQHISGYSPEGKINKLESKLSEIYKMTQDRLIHQSENDSTLKKALNVKRTLFDSKRIQEREDHIISHLDTLLVINVDVIDLFGQLKKSKINIIST